MCLWLLLRTLGNLAGCPSDQHKNPPMVKWGRKCENKETDRVNTDKKDYNIHFGCFAFYWYLDFSYKNNFHTETVLFEIHLSPAVYEHVYRHKMWNSGISVKDKESECDRIQQKLVNPQRCCSLTGKRKKQRKHSVCEKSKVCEPRNHLTTYYQQF